MSSTAAEAGAPIGGCVINVLRSRVAASPKEPLEIAPHHGSTRLVNARPLSAAGESPPVQIITPSFS
jgi:hypothetical protein